MNNISNKDFVYTQTFYKKHTQTNKQPKNSNFFLKYIRHFTQHFIHLPRSGHCPLANRSKPIGLLSGNTKVTEYEQTSADHV